jgi:hypothetical protein
MPPASERSRVSESGRCGPAAWEAGIATARAE